MDSNLDLNISLECLKNLTCLTLYIICSGYTLLHLILIKPKTPLMSAIIMLECDAQSAININETPKE